MGGYDYGIGYGRYNPAASVGRTPAWACDPEWGSVASAPVANCF